MTVTSGNETTSVRWRTCPLATSTWHAADDVRTVCHDSYMSWDWVAPTVVGAAGVFTTWFGSVQSRQHAERLLSQTQDFDAREPMLRDRRDAYLAALRCIDLDLRRRRYELEGRFTDLQQIEQLWPKAERVRMKNEALVSVNAFGSLQLIAFADEWCSARASVDDRLLHYTASRIRDQVRHELRVTDRH